MQSINYSAFDSEIKIEMYPHSSPLRAYDQCVHIKCCYTALINALNTCNKEYVTRTLRKDESILYLYNFRTECSISTIEQICQVGSTESEEGEELHKAKNEYSPRLSGRSLKRTTLCIAIHILLNEVVIFLNHPMPSRLTAATFLLQKFLRLPRPKLGVQYKINASTSLQPTQPTSWPLLLLLHYSCNSASFPNFRRLRPRTNPCR